MSNVIFLDIDGVLNCETSKSRCGSYLGIDKDKVKRLANIINATSADIILTSTWKIGWCRNPASNLIPSYDAPAFDKAAKYLNNHLWKKGKLIVKDKTKERDLNYRGTGIRNYLNNHPEVTGWVVLDDVIFPDFENEGILPHLVLTDFKIGLTDEDADFAIKIINGTETGPRIWYKNVKE